MFVPKTEQRNHVVNVRHNFQENYSWHLLFKRALVDDIEIVHNDHNLAQEITRSIHYSSTTLLCLSLTQEASMWLAGKQKTSTLARDESHTHTRGIQTRHETLTREAQRCVRTHDHGQEQWLSFFWMVTHSVEFIKYGQHKFRKSKRHSWTRSRTNAASKIREHKPNIVLTTYD